jgi:hypothetical protein
MVNVIDEGKREFADPDDINTQVREYLMVKKSMEQLEARQKELREKLFAKIDNEGLPDDKGNIQLELDSEVEGVTRLEKQRRVTRKIDEEMAEQILTANELTETVYKTVRVVDEDALMAAFYEDKISEAELDAMFPPRTVWALMTKKK